MNAYEAKQAGRKARIEAAADRARDKSNAAYKRAVEWLLDDDYTPPQLADLRPI